MANRSTRQKIRDHAGRMIQETERMFEHIQNMVELSDGRSEYIAENATMLVHIVTEVQGVFLRFRDGL